MRMNINRDQISESLSEDDELLE